MMLHCCIAALLHCCIAALRRCGAAALGCDLQDFTNQ
jgi:hypothetical protein